MSKLDYPAVKAVVPLGDYVFLWFLKTVRKDFLI